MSQEFRQHYAGGSLIKKPGLGILLAVGTTVPTGGGYAPGCIFIDENGADGSQLFVNEGTFTTASFKAIASVASGTFDTLTATNATITTGTVTTLTSTTATITNTTMTNSAVLTANTGAGGFKIGGAANQRISLWGVSPVVQPSTTGELLGLNGFADTAANATNMNSNGNSGS